MFDKLIDFVLNLKDEVIPVKIVNEWEGGIHMRAGKFLKSTQPGINFKIPFIDKFWVVFTVPQTVDLLSQTLTTKDGKNIVLKGIIRYKIEDPKKYLISVKKQYICTMIIEKDNNIESIYSYKTKDGEKYWTPSAIYAYARAEALGTNNVYVEQYEVPPMIDKFKK
jgi:hypothetical protein